MTVERIIVRCEQGAPEWRALRAGRITGSAFAAAAGIKAYKSRPALFREKTGKAAPFSGNRATRWGHKYEPEARFAYCMHEGVTVDEVGFVVRRDLPWLGVSPDGFVGEAGMLEVKCPGGGLPPPGATVESLWEEPPAYYVPQVMGQMGVCGREWCDFVCYVPDRPEDGVNGGMRIWRFFHSGEYWEELVRHLREFMTYLVADEEPPSLRGEGRRTMPEVKCERRL